MNHKDKNHFLTDTCEAMLSQDTIQSLFDKLKFNLSLEEIIFNIRVLANFMLGKRILSFSLKSVQVRPIFESDEVKRAILSKSFRELGMNKSTHWYQKKRLEQTGSLQIYNKTKHHFVK